MGVMNMKETDVEYSIENFKKMGLEHKEAEELYSRIKVVGESLVGKVTEVMAGYGDPKLYHEFLHMAHFVEDNNRIIQAVEQDKKIMRVFGITELWERSNYRETALVIAGLTHDLALTLTREGLDSLLAEKNEARLGDPNKRLVDQHHRRSKIILSRILLPGTDLDLPTYCGLMDCLELSSTKLTESESRDLMKQGRLYLTIPMIIDGVADTRENFARGIAEAPFAEDILVAYIAGKIGANEAAEGVKKIAETVNKYGSKIGEEHKFDHDAMAKRLAEKKNFPFLDLMRKGMPGVYDAIVASAESNELERALAHPWYRAGVEGGIQVASDYLALIGDSPIGNDAPAQYELCKQLEALHNALQKYEHLFTGKR
jgi:hypothetical protein